ncbi:MAG: ATP-binding protein [Candidatus Promineifilaceae bacterium]|nr:ATP-binding protein [Candidatus Promineifilaceae bacterium]
MNGSEHRLSNLLDNLPGMVYRCRNDSLWTMEFVSEGCRELTGYAPADLVDNRTIAYGELIHPEDRASVWAAVQMALREERQFQITYRIHTRDGQEKWVWEQGNGVIASDGRVVALEGFVTDITQSKRTEAKIQTQTRLATVGQLATGIAHDFNNIMAVIALYSGSLVRNPEHPKRGHYLATISEQAQHASNLIGQLLDFSRRSIIEPHPLELEPFVKEMVKLLQRTMPENMSVYFEAGDDDYAVRADPTRIQQVLMNLAVNARDAMPQGGELRITLSRLNAGLESEPSLELDAGDWVTLSVSDTGSGIPPDVLPHIFEPFFTTKQSDQGTGLGLSQVYGIVKQHGGEVAVDSVVGKGTEFTIYLPALPSDTPSVPDEEETIERARDLEAILLVEDEGAARQAIEETLKTLGYQVLTAATGEEALALFDRHHEAVDLVLSDTVMPQISGVELYHMLCERRPDVRLMLMSGYPLEDEKNSLLERDNVFWIQKPFTFAGLARAIRTALDGVRETPSAP